MTKIDFAELKEKLVKLDIMALSAEYIECCKRRQYNGLVRIEDMVKWQHSKDSAIISELIEIIQSQSEHLKMSQRYLLVNNPKTSVGDRTKLMKAIHSSLSETTTRLQKLRDGIESGK